MSEMNFFVPGKEKNAVIAGAIMSIYDEVWCKKSPEFVIRICGFVY